MRKNIKYLSSQQLQQHTQDLIERRTAPSLAVTAVQGNETVLTYGNGLADLEQGTRATPQTIYLYCSIKRGNLSCLLSLPRRRLRRLPRSSVSLSGIR